MFDSWVIYGIGAALCFSAMILVYKQLLLLGLNPLVLNASVFGLTFLGFVFWTVRSKIPLTASNTVIMLLVVAAILSLFGNYFYVKSVEIAPNPGYATTLRSTSVVVVSLAAIALFKSPISTINFLGVLLVFLGTWLLTSF